MTFDQWLRAVTALRPTINLRRAQIAFAAGIAPIDYVRYGR